MANWQERINAEINRRELQVGKPVQKPFEAPKVAPTLFDEELFEKERGIDVAIQKLKPEERNIFRLLDRIGARQMLSEIRDDVWGGKGEIDMVGDVVFGRYDPLWAPHGHENLIRIKRGLRLEFKYEYPHPVWEYKHDRKFGFHKLPYVSQDYYSLADGWQHSDYGEKTELGFYYAESGYKFVVGREIQGSSTGLEVSIEKGKERGPFFFLRVKAGTFGSYDRTYILNTDNKKPLDEAEAKKFLELTLLEDCIERKKRRTLPTDISGKMQHNNTVIDQAMREKRKFRFEKDGQKLEPLGSFYSW